MEHMLIKIRRWLYHRKRRFQDAIHKELRYQALGMIILEIENYFYENNLSYEYEVCDDDEINIYIIDKDFEDNGFFGIPHIVHLHSDMLLWYILHWEEYNAKIAKHIERYVKYKKENDNNG